MRCHRCHSLAAALRLVAALILAAVGTAHYSAAAMPTSGMEQAIRASTAEVVMKKPAPDPLSYEKPLPLELLPYKERTDLYQSVGTAFALGHNTYVTAAHVLLMGVDSQYGAPALRRADGAVFAIDSILKFSAYQDFVVFSLQDDPATPGFTVDREPKLDDPVLAVGNALGEGIVIRDGLYTSATPEDQDGRWQWIRFSAAASPGNSGGPLLDAAGRVIGIVLRKSPSENLNYSLPIGEVLDAPEAKARFDQRDLTGMPFLKDTQTYAFKDSFDLPLSWPEFVRHYQSVTTHHEQVARDTLLKSVAGTLFPKGEGTEAILYQPDGNDFLPRLIGQQQDGRWNADSPYYATTELPGDGSVRVAERAGALLLRLVRSDAAADPGFYSDSQAFMDLALKALNLRRPVGTDQVRITSLGKALSESAYVDAYGRHWRERIWAVPFMDMYLQALLLPTPDGYAGILQYVPSARREAGRAQLHLYAAHFDVSFVGTVAQWRAFLARSAELPPALADLQLDAKVPGSLRTQRFSLTVPSSLLSLDVKSELGLVMGFHPDGSQTVWDAQEAWWYRDAQRKNWLGLWRRQRPPESARRELRSAFDDMRARNGDYSGAWMHPTSDTYERTLIVNAPAKQAGLISPDLLYGVTQRVDSTRDSHTSVQDTAVLADAIRILDTGPGDGVVPEQRLADSSAGSSTEFFARMPEFVQRSIDAEDKSLGSDDRGRHLGDDLRDAYNAARAKAVAKGADSAKLRAEFMSQAAEISRYWALIPAIAHSRELWLGFLSRNRESLGTPHNADVKANESALRAVQRAGGVPDARWTEKARALVRSYVQERRDVAAHVSMGPAQYRERLSACPSPASASSGSPVAKIGRTPRSPDDFYPTQSRRTLEEGNVRVTLQIAASGCALKLGVAVSSGSEALDDAALRFVETMEFLPGEQNGKPADTIKVINVVFSNPDATGGE